MTLSDAILLLSPWLAFLALIFFDTTREPRRNSPHDSKPFFQRLRSSMIFSSNIWLVLVGFGGLLAAVGTVNFNLARDREKSVLASQKAIALLKNEIANNLRRVITLRRLIANNQMSTQRLETAAWTVVLNGGLLVEVDKPTLDRMIDIYYKVELAERYRVDILENSSGVLSALAENGARIKQYQFFLVGVLDDLEPQLQRFAESKP